jgi:Zn-dependent protease with chaperone function
MLERLAAPALIFAHNKFIRFGQSASDFGVPRMKFWLPAVAFLALLLASAPAKAQESADSPDDAEDYHSACANPQNAFLAIDADRRGIANLFLSFCVAPARENKAKEEIMAALPCPENHLELSRYTDKGLVGFEANCETRLPRRGMEFSGRLDVLSLQGMLKRAGVDSFSVLVALPSSSDATCDPSPKYLPRSAGVVPCTYAFTGRTTDPSVIQYAFGYGPARSARIIAILGSLLVLPIAITLWLRRRALHVREEAREAVWFSYFRFLRWTTLAGTLVWWTSIDLLGADAFVAFLLPSWVLRDRALAGVLPWIALWLLFATSYALCVVLSSPIHSLRGVTRTRAEAIWQSFWSMGRFVIPFSLFALAIAEIARSPRLAILLFISMFVAARLGARKLAQVYGMDPHALSSGELRDSAFAIAKKAGAKLNQLYVLPTERLRMANAFAHIGHNIFLTDYLVKRLSKREVDAVIGHEVAHLQMKHIRGRFVLVFAAVIAMSVVGGWTEFRFPRTFPSGPIFYAMFLLALFFVSRRNEFAADAGAVKLTEDPQSMMTALAKISRLNMMPMDWGRLEEKTLTHPSTLRRISRLARTAGMAEEQIPSLLRDFAKPPAETYAIPPTAVPQGKIFSTRYKSRRSSRLGWTIVLTGVTIPALVALAVQWGQFQGSALWFAYGTGLALTLSATLLLVNLAAPAGFVTVERQLREKYESSGVRPEICEGLFVGLAPHPLPRLYEGNWTWDVGLLCLTPEYLCYWGEETQFILRREEITRISVGPGASGWIKAATAKIFWRNAAGEERSFRISAPAAGSMRQIARSTTRLARDLDLWHRGLPPAPDAILGPASANSGMAESLGSPNFGTVTNHAPKELVRGPLLARDFLINTFLAASAAVLLGLPLLPVDSLGPRAPLHPTGWGALYVLTVVWLNRAFLLFPHWRSRDSKAE